MSQRTIRWLMPALTILVALAVTPAQAAKPKPPKYIGAITMTSHSNAVMVCDYAWTTDWTFSGTYSPTQLVRFATLDARTRSGSGTIQWSDSTGCSYEAGESGACALGVETPQGGFAGYEDASLHKTAGGFRVEVIVDNVFSVVGDDPCHGAFWGPNAEYVGGESSYVEPQGFIPSKQIGRKTITVPLAGSFHGRDTGRTEDGQMSGTLTLTRKGKR